MSAARNGGAGSLALPFRGAKAPLPLGRLAILAAVGLAAVASVEASRLWQADPLLAKKVAAARVMQQGMEAVRLEKARVGLAPDPDDDPRGSGMIGERMTDLTTTVGSLPSKRTSTRPEFAAAAVEMLVEAGAREGDRVAVSFSGSFPALNVAVLSAVKALGLRPVVISSVGASMYGANQPGMTWLDMEAVLARDGILPYRSAACSLGGIVDTAGGVDGTGMEAGLAAIRRNGIPFLDEGGARSVAADVARRMAVWDREMGGRPPAAFVNVGGSQTALGGVIARMRERGVPVIHLLGIRVLARRFGIPFDAGSSGGAAAPVRLETRKRSVPLAGFWLVVLGALLVRASRKTAHA